MCPTAEDRRGPPAECIPPQRLRKEPALPTAGLRTPGLWNCERLSVCVLSPPPPPCAPLGARPYSSARKFTHQQDTNKRVSPETAEAEATSRCDSPAPRRGHGCPGIGLSPVLPGQPSSPPRPFPAGECLASAAPSHCFIPHYVCLGQGAHVSSPPGTSRLTPAVPLSLSRAPSSFPRVSQIER